MDSDADQVIESSRTGQNGSNQWLKQLNRLLLITILVVNSYIIVTPFAPALLFKLQYSPEKHQALARQLYPHTDSQTASNTSANQPNRLIIPSLLLEQPIIEDDSIYRALDRGVWRWPAGSTPEAGGNTVLAGHRFTYVKPQGVFYSLDRLSKGDSVGVIWNGKPYTYTVTDTQTVPPDQTSILAATREPTLTIYTCTPLWNPTQRLVVTAKLEKEDGL